MLLVTVQVVEFHRKDRLREQRDLEAEKAMEQGDYMASFLAMWMTPFMPNLLNTCVFLVETAQCVAVLLVNYKVLYLIAKVEHSKAHFLLTNVSLRLSRLRVGHG